MSGAVQLFAISKSRSQKFYDADNQMNSLISQVSVLARKICGEHLTDYQSIISQLPQDYPQRNRCYQWKNWLETIQQNPKVDFGIIWYILIKFFF